MWHEDRLLIDGELVRAEHGATYETISPSTEEVLGTAADASVADADRAIAAARRAFDTTTWSRDQELRTRCLRQLHQALVDQRRRAPRDSRARGRRAGDDHARSAARRPDRSRAVVCRAARRVRIRRGPRRSRHVRRSSPPLGREGRRGRRRRHRRVQLPDPTRAREARPGPRGGLHSRAEGSARHTVGDARARPPHRGVH